MPAYELCLLLRVMPKPELVSTLKRTANGIFNKGGFIRKIENLGTKDMPYKTSVHGVVYRQASAPPSSLEDIQEEYSRDIDIIRQSVYKVKEETPQECTLHEEMLPAPYRKDVQKLVADARKLDKPNFKYNTGLDYYPYQK